MLLRKAALSHTLSGCVHVLYVNCPRKIGPPNSLLLPPLCACTTSAPSLSWCLLRAEASVSCNPTCRFKSSADCDVPLVNVPPVEMGTTNCVPNTTGSNCVIGEA